MEYCKDHTNCIERIRAVEESVKSAHHRIDEVQENQKILMEMNASIKTLTEQSKAQKEDISEVKQDIKELKEKPGKRWDAAIIAIITTLTGGIAGAVLALVFK